jgi:hypothetical protein
MQCLCKISVQRDDTKNRIINREKYVTLTVRGTPIHMDAHSFQLFPMFLRKKHGVNEAIQHSEGVLINGAGHCNKIYYENAIERMLYIEFSCMVNCSLRDSFLGGYLPWTRRSLCVAKEDAEFSAAFTNAINRFILIDCFGHRHVLWCNGDDCTCGCWDIYRGVNCFR